MGKNSSQEGSSNSQDKSSDQNSNQTKHRHSLINDPDVQATKKLIENWVKDTLNVKDSTGKIDELLDEANSSISYGIPIAALYHEEIAESYTKYKTNMAEKFKRELKNLGIDVDRKVDIGDGEYLYYDFLPVPYDEVEKKYIANAKYIIENGLFIGGGGRLGGPALPAPAPASIPWWLAKLLSLAEIDEADLKDINAAFTEIVGQKNIDDLTEKIEKIINSFLARRIPESDLFYDVVKAAEKILNELQMKLWDFFELLVEKFSKRMSESAALKKAKAIVSKIGSKFIPGVNVVLALKDICDLVYNNLHRFLWWW